MNPGQKISADLLNPFTFQSHFSLGTSWLIYYSLYTLFEVSEEYYDKKSEKVQQAFDNLQFITEAFAEELVNSGKWQLAMYVLRYCKNGSKILNTLINRNVYIEDNNLHQTHLEQVQNITTSAKALHDKHMFEFDNAFDGFMINSQVVPASNIVIQNLAPLFIIKYEGRVLYKKLFINILKRLKDAAGCLSVILLEEDIYIDYCELAYIIDSKEKPQTDEEILDLLQRIEIVLVSLKNLPRATYFQKIAISIMQTSLNKWKLKILALRDKVNGYVRPELLNYVNHCKKEDILRLYENIGFKLLKSMVRE